MKVEAPSTNIQAPENLQASILKAIARSLELDDWNFLGTWRLGFGTLIIIARSFDKLEPAPLFSARGIYCALTPEANWSYGFRFACQFVG
jgi:hypothetical protein